MLERLCDEVRIVIAKVVEENRQLILLPQLEITFGVGRTAIPASKMVVISNLFLPGIVFTESSVANEAHTLPRMTSHLLMSLPIACRRTESPYISH